MKRPLVGILMGSASDKAVMEEAAKALDALGVPCEMRVLSAHRTPEALRDYVREAPGRGVRVLIAGAGMAAHLAGAVGGATDLPVIGVPIDRSALGGLDALLSTVQMPPGIPVATMGIGAAGARNAGLFAARILALGDTRLATRYRRFAQEQTDKALAADRAIQKGTPGSALPGEPQRARPARRPPTKRAARKK